MVRAERSTDDALVRSTLEEIESGLKEVKGRNGLKRCFHTLNDDRKITGWKTSLEGALRLFGVRFATPGDSIRPLLTVCFQTEITISTNVLASDILHNVTNTHTSVSRLHRDVLINQTMISGLRDDFTNTRAIASSTHRKMLSREGPDNHRSSVSVAYTLSTTE